MFKSNGGNGIKVDKIGTLNLVITAVTVFLTMLLFYFTIFEPKFTKIELNAKRLDTVEKTVDKHQVDLEVLKAHDNQRIGADGAKSP